MTPPAFQPSRRRAAESPPGSPGDEAAGSLPRSEPLESDGQPGNPTTSSFPGSTDAPVDDDRPWWRRGGLRASGAERVVMRDPKELIDGIAQGVHFVGDELNDRLAPGTELYLTDESDEQGLAKPTARLMLRRLPPELSTNSDFADAIAAAAVLARYVVKQLNLLRLMRRQRREAAAAGQVPYGTPPEGEAAA